MDCEEDDKSEDGLEESAGESRLLVVLLADAVVHQSAVVVEAVHTPVAPTTVFGRVRDEAVALETEEAQVISLGLSPRISLGYTPSLRSL